MPVHLLSYTTSRDSAEGFGKGGWLECEEGLAIDLGERRMKVNLNREIKAYCPDFGPVRQILRDRGATFIETKEQVDRYYHLPELEEGAGTRRLKLRKEGEKSELIYYRDYHENDTRVSHFQLWQMPDCGTLEVLEAVLGKRVVVRKVRELWHKDNIKFNLDEVDGVGRIFELEAQDKDGHDIEAQVEQYRRLLVPYITDYITCSNEDLVGSSS